MWFTKRHGGARGQRSGRGKSYRPRVELLERRDLPSTFLVTNSNDSGPGSLRQAILGSNAQPGVGGPNAIDFAILGGRPQPIQVQSPLPAITAPVIIDGTSQPGVNGQPLIFISGAVLPTTLTHAVGLDIVAGGSTVEGIAISGFSGTAIRLEQAGGNAIVANFIGTDPTGAAATTAGDGIDVLSTSANNTIGGNAPGSANLIAGTSATGQGLLLAGSANLVQGNFIGTNAAGTKAVANGVGINVTGSGNTIGGTVSGARNVIAGNSVQDIKISGTGTLVEGNYIGTNLTGTAALGSAGDGVLVAAGTGTTIGGTVSGAGNLISGHTGSGTGDTAGVGIAVEKGVKGTVIEGNLIGTDATGTTAVGNVIGVSLSVSGGGNLLGAPAAGNTISGNTKAGVDIPGSDDVVRGNDIGTNAAGSGAVANGVGITIEGAGNTIGGTTTGTGNLISGNTGDGVDISGTSNVLVGNRIGIVAVGNGGSGVVLTGGGNAVGNGSTAGSNTIAFNGQDGVLVNGATGNGIRRNSIFDNGSGLGIQLLNGGNRNIGAPHLTSATFASGTLTVQGSLVGTAGTTYMLEFYLNGLGDAEGQTFLGLRSLTPTATGTTPFTVSFKTTVSAGFRVTATVTDPQNDTSAFSNGPGDQYTSTTFTVTTTADSGAGSLRQALLDADANAGHANGPDTIAFNISGSGVQTITLASGLPQLRDAAVIDGTSQPGYAGTPLIVLNGGNVKAALPGQSAVTGLDLAGGHSAVRGLAIGGFAGIGVLLEVAGNDSIQADDLGTDAAGATTSANQIGVEIAGTSSNTIGGTANGVGNLISGNSTDGVDITGTNNLVQGNRIGTDATGTKALANGTGVVISGGSNTLGGAVTGAGNTISGNTADGVDISGSGTLLQGNRIGTDAAGTAALANQAAGVVVSGSHNTLGGNTAAAANLISGNTKDGLDVSGAGNIVQGNRIGTDAAATVALPNGGSGVVVSAGSNTIGGTVTGAGNIVSGNVADGISVSGSGNLLEGNEIGTDASGATALANGTGLVIAGNSNTVGGMGTVSGNLISGNSGDGADVSGAANEFLGDRVGTDASGSAALPNVGSGIVLTGSGNLVGNGAGGGSNTVAFNGQDGVLVNGGSGDTVSRNSIFDNGSGLGIQLLSGGNAGIRAPHLTSATFASGTLTVQGSLVGTAGTTYLVEFYLNGLGDAEGQTFLGFRSLTPTTTGTLPFTASFKRSVAPGFRVTATVTDAQGDTSAFSNGPGDQYTATTFTVTTTADSGPGSLRQALLDADANAGHPGAPDTIAFTIAGSGAQTIALLSVLPQVRDVVIIDGTTQPGYAGTPLVRVSGTGVRLALPGEPAAAGIDLAGGSSTVRGLDITGFGGFRGSGIGVLLEQVGGDLVQADYVGVDPTGARAAANQIGVLIYGTSGNTVGGTASGTGNLISGNSTGIDITGSGNLIEGNQVGTTAAGTAAVGNGIGVEVEGDANTVGGTAVGAGNLISGNRSVGLFLPGSKNLVQGNRVGTDITGTTALANGSTGIADGGVGNTVGGTASGAGNLISGNTGIGLHVTGVQSLIAGNRIGTALTGTVAVANGSGVLLAGTSNTLGGAAAGAGNLVSGNTGDGVDLYGTANRVQGNAIGTDVSGQTAVGNGGAGVVVFGSNDFVGGVAAGAANIVAFNGQDGIVIDGGTADALHRNAIFSNTGVGIALEAGGNHNQPAPKLASAVFNTTTGKLTVKGSLTAAPNTLFTLEFFANPAGDAEGKVFLGSVTFTTGAAGSVSFTVTFSTTVMSGQLITATATDPGNNTSAFSAAATVS